jgi:starch-binding outer membrane protein, SusD/RagB family
MFMGDTDPYTEFRNRDRRLYFVTPPPYRVTASGTTYTLMADPKYSEYINLMKTLSDDKHKTLPLLQWAGTVVKTSPHFRKYNEGQGFNVTYTGYQNYKYYNKISMTSLQDIHDFPIFRMGEILVNYAEAMYELAKFDQTIADKTINKLRSRGGVAALNIANIIPDPTRDADVNPVLWEIRRERAVELMGEGYRYDDVRRWKKFQEYGGVEKLGRWVKNSDYGNALPIQGGATAGYVSPYGVPPGVPDYYDLIPIPSDQIVLNPNLKQNPGWQ